MEPGTNHGSRPEGADEEGHPARPQDTIDCVESKRKAQEKMVSLDKADFSDATKEQAAKRAGYRCSFPGCNRVTIGPGAGPEDVASIGTCCHIYASSPGGPRGTGGLSKKERSSLANAFWACADHGRLIDTNDGNRYPSEMLQSYKRYHESRIAMELGHKIPRMGWFHRLRVLADPHFRPFELFLGDTTLVTGYPGKTALCERIAGCVDVGHLWRWLPEQDNPESLHYELRVIDPLETVLTVKAGKALDDVTLLENGKEVPVWSRSARAVFLKHFEDYSCNSDEISFVAKVLGLEGVNVINLLPYANAMSMCGVTNLQARPDDGGYSLHGDLRGTRAGLSFVQWSHGERALVFAVLALSLAQFHGKHQSTILILDGGMNQLDDELFAQLYREISTRTWGFQIVVARNTPGNVIDWTGWMHFRVSESAFGAEVLSAAIRPD